MNKILSTLFAALILISAPVRAELANMELEYQIHYGSTHAGSLNISITHDGEQYQMASATKPKGIAKMFLKSYTTATQFTAAGNDFKLLNGSEVYKGKESDDLSFVINYDSKEVQLSNGEAIKFAAENLLDFQTFPLLLMIEPPQQVSGNTYIEVSAKKVRNYTYTEVSEETLSMPDGDQLAWKVTKLRDNNPEITTTVWISQKDNVPLRIESLRKGKITRISLESARIQ